MTEEDTGALLDAGSSRGALFEVVAQAGHTTLANYAPATSHAPLDSAFAPQAWERAAA